MDKVEQVAGPAEDPNLPAPLASDVVASVDDLKGEEKATGWRRWRWRFRQWRARKAAFIWPIY